MQNPSEEITCWQEPTLSAKFREERKKFACHDQQIRMLGIPGKAWTGKKPPFRHFMLQAENLNLVS